MIQANELIAQEIPGEPDQPVDMQLVIKSGQRENAAVYAFRVPARMWSDFSSLVKR